MTVRRRENTPRLCRRCARLVPEAAYPEGTSWICRECVAARVPAAMPLIDRGGHERYDTRAVFAGLRVKKVRQGASREQYEVEVPSQFGEFFPVAEACVGLQTTSGRIAGALLKEFPTVRLFTASDDGRYVLHLPVETFPAVAKRCGAFKSRAGREPSPAELERRRKLAERNKQLTLL